MIDPGACPKRRERVLKKRVSDTSVLLDIETGQYYKLNDTGDQIWDLSDGTRPVSEIVAAICQGFDAEPGSIESDVLDFLKDLTSEGLVDAGDSDAPRQSEGSR